MPRKSASQIIQDIKWNANIFPEYKTSQLKLLQLGFNTALNLAYNNAMQNPRKSPEESGIHIDIDSHNVPFQKNLLKRGKSRQAIAYNIAQEMRHGKPQRQAIAIAMRKAGVARNAKIKMKYLVQRIDVKSGTGAYTTFAKFDNHADAMQYGKYLANKHPHSRFQIRATE